MTIQQEAYHLIDTLPEDSVRIIVELMYKMKPLQAAGKGTFCISDYVTPTERAEYANEYVQELRTNDRM